MCRLLYRPPNSDLSYQITISGNFNLPHIDWLTCLHSRVKQFLSIFPRCFIIAFLWQLADFPATNDNILDLVITNTPDKILNLEGFDDILNTLTTKF
jgi:hypothetical protein